MSSQEGDQNSYQNRTFERRSNSLLDISPWGNESKRLKRNRDIKRLLNSPSDQDSELAPNPQNMNTNGKEEQGIEGLVVDLSYETQWRDEKQRVPPQRSE